MNDAIDNIGAGGGGEVAFSDASPAAAPIDTGSVGFDSPAAAPAEPAAEAPASTPDGGDEAAKPQHPHKELLDEIDNLGATPAEEPQKSTTQESEALSEDESDAETPPTTSADDTQSEDEGTEPSGEEAAATDEAASDGDEDIPDADWNKMPAEVEAEMQKNIPKNQWKEYRKNFRQAAMARSFMNPNCPPSVVVDNLMKKSAMRYGAVESEILKRNIEADPVAFLGKVFEATQDDTGNSEPYQRLLDSVVTTNLDYVQEMLKSQGLEVVKAGEAGTSAERNGTGGDLSSISDDEIDGILESAAFYQLAETFPEEAEKLESLLGATKEMRAKAAEAEANAAGDKEDQNPDAAAAEAQNVTYVNDFSSVYEPAITAPITTKLEKEFGLEVSAEEREKSPMMAFLKDAKKALVLSGGLEGGDFDNDLYEWGQSRPAFKDAAKSMVEFTRAGEKENAAAAAKELLPFAETFLTEQRMKSPHVKMIDEIIQIVAKHQKSGLEQREDQVPDGHAKAMSVGGPGKSFMDEIDAM